MNTAYLFDSSKFILVVASKLDDGNYVSMNTEEGIRELSEEFLDVELGTLLKHGAIIGYDNRLPRYDRDTYDKDHAVEYGKYLAFMNSGIKIVDPYHFVADSVKQGFEVIKW